MAGGDAGEAVVDGRRRPATSGAGVPGRGIVCSAWRPTFDRPRDEGGRGQEPCEVALGSVEGLVLALFLLVPRGLGYRPGPQGSADAARRVRRMGVLRSFADREEAERALGWLRRSGLTPVLRDMGGGRCTLEVPSGQEARAEGILQAVAGIGHLAELPPTPRWRRVLAWENVATLFAIAMGLLLMAVLVVGFGGLVRWFGVGGVAAFCVAGILYVAYSGFSAANEKPEPVSRGQGMITQNAAATVSYRRAWIRQTWGLTNWRKKARENRGLLPEPTSAAPAAADAGSPAPRRVPPHLIRCHRCERLVGVDEDKCPFCTAPRPGRP